MSRDAKLYLLDEPIGGVDPATRDYILRTIIGNYSEDAAVIISTHLIADVEQILDEVVFLREGRSCSTRAWRPFEMKRARALTSSSGRYLDAEQTDQT